MAQPLPATKRAGGGPGLYIIREDGTGMQRLNTTVAGGAGRGGGGRGGGGFGGGGNEPQWSRDGRSIYMLQGGSIYAVAVRATCADSCSRSRRRSSAVDVADAAAAAAATTTATAATPAPARAASPSPCAWKSIVAAERKQVFEEAWRVMKNRFYDRQNARRQLGRRQG